MENLNKYRQIIPQVLSNYLNIAYANANIKNRAAFDLERDQYLIISEGWQQSSHHHSCLIHLEIIQDKVWIQCDNTEHGITNDLVKAGIPSENIVLGFQEPSVRKYTGFALA
jgi:hypothetical protein